MNLQKSRRFSCKWKPESHLPGRSVLEICKKRRIGNMKNLKLFLLFGLALATFYSCSKETVTSATQPSLKHYVITAANGVDTRAVWTDGTSVVTTKWVVGDKIFVYNSNFTMLNSSNDAYTMTCTKVSGNTGTFEGNLPSSLNKGDKLYLIFAKLDRYRQNRYNRIQSIEKLAATDYLDGTLASLYGSGAALISGETTVGNTSTVTFTPRFSILKLTFTFPTTIAVGTSVSQLGVVADAGLYSVYCSDATNGYVKVAEYCTGTGSETTTAGSWTIDSNNNLGPIYLIVFPGEVKNMYGVAKVADVSYITSAVITKNATTTFVSGKVYSKTISGLGKVDDVVKYEGSGTQADPYKIASFANLKYMSQNSSDWSKYFVQTADIRMNGKTWTPIGPNYTNPFKGTYDGQGYKISGNMVMSGTYDNGGIFGYLYAGTIKNVHFDGTIDCSGITTATTTNIGAVVGTITANSTVEYCSNSADIALSSTNNNARYVGGVIGGTASGIRKVKIIACVNTGNITNVISGRYWFEMGGIIGSYGVYAYNDENSLFIGCVNTGNISGAGKIGGLIGYASGEAYGTGSLVKQNICSSWSTATSVANGSSGAMGAFIGINLLNVNHCYYKAIDGLNFIGGQNGTFKL
jgi:hypothetical protein